MNAIENENSNYLAAPCLSPYCDTAFAMVELQMRRMLAVTCPLLVWYRKKRLSFRLGCSTGPDFADARP